MWNIVGLLRKIKIKARKKIFFKGNSRWFWNTLWMCYIWNWQNLKFENVCSVMRKPHEKISENPSFLRATFPKQLYTISSHLIQNFQNKYQCYDSNNNDNIYFASYKVHRFYENFQLVFLTCLGKSCQGGSWTSWARSGWLKPGRVARRCCKILTKNFYFHFHYFFSTYSYRNAILRRFYSCHFLVKRQSLGVTGVFL